MKNREYNQADVGCADPLIIKGRKVFSGSDYDRVRDRERLLNQINTIFLFIKDGKWRTLREIHNIIFTWSRKYYGEASISAQLRNLRKEHFGGYRVEKRYKGSGLWEYRVLI